MPSVTVAGAYSQTVTFKFDTNANAAIAQQLAAAITAGVHNATIVPAEDISGRPPSLPPGKTGEYIQTRDGVTKLPSGYASVLDVAKNAVIFGSGDANESVLISDGDAAFIATGGSGTVVGGSGDHRIIIGPSVTGGWSINTENGNDAIYARGSGNDTINAGGGHNLIRLGSGSDLIQSTGADTVYAGSGHETITASGAGSTVVYGNASTLNFAGGSGSATVFGGSGSDTFHGGAGPDLVYGGTGGHNLLQAGTGAATLFGGGNGDQLIAAGNGAQALHAGAGNETLLGGGSSGHDTFYGGTGNVSITGGSGTNLFAFTDGQAGGSASIKGFVSGRDEVDLQGYGDKEVQKALKTQTVVGGTDTITLSDHTTISFANVSHLTASDFITSDGGGVAANGGDHGKAGGHDNDGNEGHGHGSHGMTDMDDHGHSHDSIIGHF